MKTVVSASEVAVSFDRGNDQKEMDNNAATVLR